MVSGNDYFQLNESLRDLEEYSLLQSEQQSQTESRAALYVQSSEVTGAQTLTVEKKNCKCMTRHMEPVHQVKTQRSFWTLSSLAFGSEMTSRIVATWINMPAY